MIRGSNSTSPCVCAGSTDGCTAVASARRTAAPHAAPTKPLACLAPHAPAGPGQPRPLRNNEAFPPLLRGPAPALPPRPSRPRTVPCLIRSRALAHLTTPRWAPSPARLRPRIRPVGSPAPTHRIFSRHAPRFIETYKPAPPNDGRALSTTIDAAATPTGAAARRAGALAARPRTLAPLARLHTPYLSITGPIFPPGALPLTAHTST
jgi:hypothetical protein